MSIITAPDGTRYRLTGEFPRSSQTPGYCHAMHEVVESWAFSADQHRIEVGEPLPHIRNWPAGIGTAPQYLVANEDAELREGDVVCHLEEGDHRITTISDVDAAFNGTLSAFVDWDEIQAGGHDQGVWLLRRADPEADV